jgi:transposase-like protein
MLVNCRNGVSSCEIARTLGITQKSAWFMLQRLRLALQEKSFVKLGGPGSEVEVDETFIGGKARNMHRSVRARRITGRGKSIEDKTAVMGMLERGGQVRATVITNRSKEVLQGLVRGNVTTGASVFTDELHGYWGLADEYEHQIIDHAVKYVDGCVHTNGMENFWSLLKRGLHGTYVSVEPFHLYRYVDEQAFRFNTRKDAFGRKISDAERFAEAMSRVAGHRLTYAQLTGKNESPRHEAAGPGPEQVPF